MNYELMIGLGIVILINLIVFIRFERSKPEPKDILPLIVVCCAASLGRLIFSVIPQVQPVTVLVIIIGSAYGCTSGYITGALCAVISNIFLGEGPWTLFQMLGWGMVGCLAGGIEMLIKNKSVQVKKYIYAGYSFFAAILFSVITDTLSVLYMGKQITLGSALTIFATGISFNIVHAIFNVILMLFLYQLLYNRLKRIRRKATT